jgi:adenine-specific DNA-methyltransferase
MHLDDIENETAPRVEQYLSKIKVIRKIAGKIIDFLAQLEDFQKKLWLKKKFVVETHYCITVGSIPEEFYPEIAANEAQREEWVRLLAIDELKTTSGSLLEPERPGYSVPLTSDFLMRHPTLVVDTRLFDASLIERLLHTINNVSENTQGVLLHSENFQALSLVRARFSGAVPVVYIDPPYNTPYSQILYKNDYAHSSWLSLIANCLPVTADLWAPSFAFAIAIDDYEAVNLAILLDRYFPNLERSTVVVNHHPQGSGGRLSRTHEYLFLLSSKDAPKYLGEPLEDSDEDRNFMRSGTAENNYRHGRWKSFYALLVDPASRRIVDAEPPVPLNEALPSDATDDGLIRIFPINSRGEHRVWRSSYETGKARARAGELSLSVRGAVYQSIQHSEKRQTLFSNWIGPEFNAGTNGTGLIADLGFGGFFDYPKAMGTMEQCLWAASYGATDALVLDYFGGSGTTMHAVIRMNQKDGGERRFVLAEVGAHMDSVIIPRLKKTVFTPEWKDGKPKRLATPDEALRIPRVVKILRLESYEDALNNLETRRTGTQQSLLSSPEAQGPDGLKEQYLLRYMLNVETQGSQSLLNVQAFQDPTAYKLKVKRPGSDESREVNVDLLETFNWLIGLTVWHIAAPQTFSAAFERDTERRLRLKDRLRQEVDGPYWFRTVTGSTPDGRKALIIWRKLLSDPEQDNLVLDEWFTRQGYSSKDSEFDLIWVNGGNNLENLKTPDDRWKVRLIEEDFHRLMFDTEGA